MQPGNLMFSFHNKKCIFLLTAALYPLVTLKKWKTKKKIVVFEIFRHLMLPAGLIIAMNCIAPSFVIRLFAKDIWIVTVICICLLLLAGVLKLITVRTKDNTEKR